MFKINYAEGTAQIEEKTKKGNIKKRNYLIFLDQKGAFVSTRKSKKYLNEFNSQII